MFRSLLVPLDGSPDAAAALPVARGICAATGGSIKLLRVHAHGAEAALEAANYLEGIAIPIRDAGLSVEVIVRHGDPARELLFIARERKIDLIVMATHAPGRQAMTSLISVAHWIVPNSPAPVVLIPPGARVSACLQTLLVPIDGSPGASLALAAASALARVSGAHIELLQVVVPVPAPAYAALPGMTLGGTIDPAWETEALASARSYVEHMARRLSETGHTAGGHVAVGEVANQIALSADAADADMIVMSTHAIRWPVDATTRSVAEAVLRTANRPLLLLRREPLAGA